MKMSEFDYSGLPIWLPTLFKIASFVLNRRKKHIQVWNNMRVSDDNIYILG